MAVKTFSVGEVLTASDTNTYLANSGLQYVASGTFTNAASFDVTGFTSTWDLYQLTVSAYAHSVTNGTVTAVLYSGSTARNTNYYGGQYFTSYLAASGTYGVRNNAANMAITIITTGTPSLVNMWISGIANTKFNMNIQNSDNYSVYACNGSYMNFAATNSFDMIRFSSTQNATGFWNLMGVRKG